MSARCLYLRYALIPATLILATLIFAGCDESTLVATEDRPDEVLISPGHATSGEGVAAFMQPSIQNRYIFLFKEGTADIDGLAEQLVDEHAGTLLYTYTVAVQGFAAELPGEEAAAAIAGHDDVVYVEADQYLYALDTQPNPPSWGIDRINQRYLPLDSAYSYSTTGVGVNAYIIDSGLDHDHPDFGGRARFGVDFIYNDGEDCLGHGTHVGGIVGSTTYGVAKDVTLWSVRVFGCRGSTPESIVIAAIDWVTQHAQFPAVVNMSLGGSFSAVLNQAVANSIAAGIPYAIAAGNEDQDACNVSPASTPEALTVGSTKIVHFDERSHFSNWGRCVDLFAPGSDITSTFLGGTNGVLSGTSMAAPHVAGVAALYLEANPTAPPTGPGSVTTAILDNTTPSIIINPGLNSPNLLLYNEVTGPSPAFTIRLKRTYINQRDKGVAVIKWNAAEVSTNKADVYQDGVFVRRTRNDGKYKHKISNPGGGAYDLHLCEKGSTTICSNVVTADFSGAVVTWEPDPGVEEDDS